MLFFMASWLRKFICSNLLVFPIPLILTMFPSFKRLFMALNRPLEPGTARTFSFCLDKDLSTVNVTNSLFIRKSSSSITILFVYVDDILLIGSSAAHIQSLIQQMHIAFAIKELGSISYFLGISIKSVGSSYVLSQHKYASEILAKAGMTSCKPCNTPIVVKPFTTLSNSLFFHQHELYRSLVGALQYLTITRPDLSLAVNQVCQHIMLHPMVILLC
ncbi:hypothetical protein CsSME_00028007 [Camellia sinensis var. sinensis]